MDFRRFFRSFLGEKDQQDVFPFEIDEDDETAPEKGTNNKWPPHFFGPGNSSIEGMVYHFQSDMQQQMESIHQQMDEIFKGFGSVSSEHFEPVKEPEFVPDDRSFTWQFNFPDVRKEGKDAGKDLRDLMLRESEKQKSRTSLPNQSSPDPENSWFNKPFAFSPWDQSSYDQKSDSDLDGKFSSTDIMRLMRKSDEGTLPGKETPGFQSFSSSQSVTMTTVRSEDGTLEKKRVVRDSSGNEESTVSRTRDGQTHTVRTIKRPDGQEEKHESFTNMDQKDIHKFDEKWIDEQRQEKYKNVQDFNFRMNLNPSDWNLFSRIFRDN